MRKWMVNGAAAAFAAFAATAANAQFCEDFEDVQQSNTLVCPAVEWVKNRSITAGCDATHYCPNNAVTRAQMAIFLQRAGKVLSPEVVAVQDAIDTATVLPEAPNPAVTMCIASTIAPASYPRKALINSMVSLQASAAGATFRAFNLMIVDGAAPTGPTPTSAAARGSVSPSGWDTVALTEATNLDPGKSYVFFVGVRPDNFTGQGGTAQRIRCQLTVSVTNRNL